MASVRVVDSGWGGKYLMKGVMVLLLPGAVLREQLIKTAAGRLSITAGALAEQSRGGWRAERSGASSPPLNVFTEAPGLLMLAQRANI